MDPYLLNGSPMLKKATLAGIAVLVVSLAIFALEQRLRKQIKIPTLPPVRPPSRIIFFHGDLLHSSMVLTDKSASVVQANDYTPYGEIIPESNKESLVLHLYTGEEWDGLSELFYYGYRYYDPITAGWMSVDPADEYPSPYAYVGNSPILFADPQGQYRVNYLGSEGMFKDPWNRHAGAAVTMEEFIKWAEEKNLETSEKIMACLMDANCDNPEPGQKLHRYVLDPGNPDAVLDMPHFLESGQAAAWLLCGEWCAEGLGLGYELNQWARFAFISAFELVSKPIFGIDFESVFGRKPGYVAMLRESSFDREDLYANAVGGEFFEDPDDLRKRRTFLEWLKAYSELRKAEYERYIDMFWEDEETESRNNGE